MQGDSDVTSPAASTTAKVAGVTPPAKEEATSASALCPAAYRASPRGTTEAPPSPPNAAPASASVNERSAHSGGGKGRKDACDTAEAAAEAAEAGRTERATADAATPATRPVAPLLVLVLGPTLPAAAAAGVRATLVAAEQQHASDLTAAVLHETDMVGSEINVCTCRSLVRGGGAVSACPRAKGQSFFFSYNSVRTSWCPVLSPWGPDLFADPSRDLSKRAHA